MPHPLTPYLEQRVATVGRPGTGKTNSARGGVEEALYLRHRVCVIDPLDAWWGLRVQRDGKTPAYQIVIFGGEHADIPITDKSGTVVGRAVAESTDSCIISLGSLIGDSARRRFCQAFLAELYERNRDPVLLVVDEADMLAPQKPQDGYEALLGHMQDIVRRGRTRGFCPWLITQRPAVLNKDVLSMTDVLVAMNLTSTQDRNAIGEWVKGQADEGMGKQVKTDLPKLKRGEGFLWAPQADVLERVQFPLVSTYDSGRTPKRGEKVTRTTLQPIDAKGIIAMMADLEKAEAKPPAAAKGSSAPTIAATRQQADLNHEQLQRAEDVGRQMGVKAGTTIGYLRGLERTRRQVVVMSEHVADTLAKLDQEIALYRTYVGDAAATVPHGTPAKSTPAPEISPPGAIVPKPAQAAAASPAPPVAPGNGSVGLPLDRAAQRAILTVLAQQAPKPVPLDRLAAMSGYSRKSSGFRNALSFLRTQQYIEQGQPFMITAAGLATLGAFSPLPTGHALLQFWSSKMERRAEKEVLAVLSRVEEATSSEIAERAGYSKSSSGYRNALSRLRTLGLISGMAKIRLSPDLRGEG